MDTVCSKSPVFGLDQVPVLHFGQRRACRVDELMRRGTESGSARMKSGWDGFVTAKETSPG